MGMIKEFGIGFLGMKGLAVKDMVRYAKLAEERGFGTCWVAEDYFFRGAFSTAAAIAVQTESIRVGIGVLNPYTRHPVLTAMELASLDEVAQGRVILGVGASNKLWMERLGISYIKPKRSVAECVEIIRQLFHGEEVKYKGQRFQIDKVKFDFDPLRPSVPIYLGVVGPQSLELAGEIADGLLLSVMTSPQYVRYALEHVRRGAERAHRDLSNFDVGAYLLISMSEDEAAAKDAVRPLIGAFIGMAGRFNPDPILTCTGLTSEDIEPLTEAVSKGQDVSPLVTEWMLDTFTIAGTPEQCRHSLSRLIDAGVTSPVAFEIPGLGFNKLIDDVAKFLIPYLTQPPESEVHL